MSTSERIEEYIRKAQSDGWTLQVGGGWLRPGHKCGCVIGLALVGAGGYPRFGYTSYDFADATGLTRRQILSASSGFEGLGFEDELASPDGDEAPIYDREMHALGERFAKELREARQATKEEEK